MKRATSWSISNSIKSSFEWIRDIFAILSEFYKRLKSNKKGVKIYTMDITIEVEDYILNVRAAVVIIHNDRILVHRNINSNHYALVGGRVQLGEDSIATVKREIK